MRRNKKTKITKQEHDNNNKDKKSVNFVDGMTTITILDVLSSGDNTIPIIFSFLRPKDMIQISRTSKPWNAIYHSDIIQKSSEIKENICWSMYASGMFGPDKIGCTPFDSSPPRLLTHVLRSDDTLFVRSSSPANQSFSLFNSDDGHLLDSKKIAGDSWFIKTFISNDKNVTYLVTELGLHNFHAQRRKLTFYEIVGRSRLNEIASIKNTDIDILKTALSPKGRVYYKTGSYQRQSGSIYVWDPKKVTRKEQEGANNNQEKDGQIQTLLVDNLVGSTTRQGMICYEQYLIFSNAKEIQVWSTNRNIHLRTIQCHKKIHEITGGKLVTATNNNERKTKDIVICSYTQGLSILSIDDGSVLCNYLDPIAISIQCLAMSSKNNTIVALAADAHYRNIIKVWKLVTKTTTTTTTTNSSCNDITAASMILLETITHNDSNLYIEDMWFSNNNNNNGTPTTATTASSLITACSYASLQWHIGDTTKPYLIDRKCKVAC